MLYDSPDHDDSDDEPAEILLQMNQIPVQKKTNYATHPVRHRQKTGTNLLGCHRSGHRRPGSLHHRPGPLLVTSRSRFSRLNQTHLGLQCLQLR